MLTVIQCFAKPTAYMLRNHILDSNTAPRLISNANMLSLHVIRRDTIPASPPAHKATARSLHESLAVPTPTPPAPFQTTALITG